MHLPGRREWARPITRYREARSRRYTRRTPASIRYSEKIEAHTPFLALTASHDDIKRRVGLHGTQAAWPRPQRACGVKRSPSWR